MIDFDALVLGPVMTVFGQPVTYEPASGDPAMTLTAVFDEEYLALDPLPTGALIGMPSNITTARPVLGIQLSQISTAPQQGDQVTIQATGAVYSVVEVRPDGHGWAKLLLNEAC